jgi:hypothetical protein
MYFKHLYRYMNYHYCDYHYYVYYTEIEWYKCLLSGLRCRNPPASPLLRRTQPHQLSRAAVPASPQPCARPSSWESFFLDSPPPPPARGQPATDEVDLVPETPDPRGASTDPAPTYAEVLLRRPFTPPQRPASLARPNPAGKSFQSSGIPRTDGRFV